MTDETTTTSAAPTAKVPGNELNLGASAAAPPADKPLAAEQKIADPEPEVSDADLSAVDRLRRFEDEHIGHDAPRIGGQLERGVGSLFSRMPDEDRAHHARLEKLVAAEAKMVTAEAALNAAKAEHAEAQKAVDNVGA